MDEFSGIRLPPFKSDPFIKSGLKSNSYKFRKNEFILKCHSKAEFLLHKAYYDPSSLLKTRKLERNKSFFDRLRDLFIESRKRAHTDFVDCNLLQKVVQRARLNYLVINLFDIKLGFTLCIKTPAKEQYVCSRPYEDSSILDYIDNEEVPYDFLDVLEQYPHNFFYNGCCIAQVRDFKGSKGGRPLRSCFVLLKQRSTVNQSLFGGIRSKREERAAESQLLFENSDPLCLEPDVTVSIITNNRAYYRSPFSCPTLRALVTKRRRIALKTLVESNYVQQSNKLLSYIESVQLEQFEPELSAIKCFKFKQLKPIFTYLTVYPSIEPSLKRRYMKSATDFEPNTVYKHVKIEEFIFEYEEMEDDCSSKFIKDSLYVSQTPFDGLYHGTLICRGKRLRKANFFPLGRRSYLDMYISQLAKTLSLGYTSYLKVTRKEPGDIEKYFYLYNGDEYPDDDVTVSESTFEKSEKSSQMNPSKKSNFTEASSISQDATINAFTSAKEKNQIGFPVETGNGTYVTDNNDLIPTTEASSPEDPLIPSITMSFDCLQFSESESDENEGTESSSDCKFDSSAEPSPIKIIPITRVQI